MYKSLGLILSTTRRKKKSLIKWILMYTVSRHQVLNSALSYPAVSCLAPACCPDSMSGKVPLNQASSSTTCSPIYTPYVPRWIPRPSARHNLILALFLASLWKGNSLHPVSSWPAATLPTKSHLLPEAFFTSSQSSFLCGSQALCSPLCTYADCLAVWFIHSCACLLG
jgi:hypothetical protein